MSTDKSEGPHSKAFLVQSATQAAKRLQVSEQELATIVGGSDPNNDDPPLKGSPNVSEKAALFPWIYHLLDTVAGGDAATTISWLRSYNTALTGCPIEMMRSCTGLGDVLGYLCRLTKLEMICDGALFG